MARFLNALARPWQLPPFPFILLLGLNRLLLREALKLESPTGLTPLNLTAHFGAECLKAFFISLFIAASIFLLLKLTKTLVEISFSELISLSLKAQGFYLLAAPVALVFLNLNEHFAWPLLSDAAKFLRGLLPLTIFATLFFLLKKRLKNLSEIRVLSLVFAPYLLFVGAIMAALVAIASVCALVIIVAIFR